MTNLSVAQSAVVTAPLGAALQVLASAGSGKTRVLTERVRHILESTKKDGVIAITFTNKAAEEMRNRLDDLEEVDERCWISTIHSVAQRIVDQYGHSIGLPTELHIYEREQDRKAVFLQALRDGGTDIDAFLDVADSKARKQREQVIQTYLERFSEVKRELLLEDEARERFCDNKDFWEAYQAYQSALIQGGGMDFDDILVFAHRILVEQPWCGQIYRTKYKHVCVDEAQDLNRAQYEFLKALCAGETKSVMMVGDPNQMIYGFNGSSHDFLCNRFVEDFGPEKFELKENYRSSRAVVRAANNLKPESQVGVDYALAGEFSIHAFDSEQQEANWICDKIGELLELKNHVEIEGEISLSKMVVLARNRFVFQAIEKELKIRQVSFSLNKGERKAEPASVFGKVLDLAVRLRLNPKDWLDGKKLCAALKVQAPTRWNDTQVLNQIAASAKSAEIPFPEVQARLLEAIAEIDLEEPNVPKFCAEFIKTFKALGVEQIPGDDEAEPSELERSLLELQDFRRSWTRFKRKGLGNSLAAFRNAMALGQISEDLTTDGLTLSTVHTMKGLEKDIVFLMGMCEGVFPDYRAQSAKELSEELNNAFVAVTRSRRWIYVTYPQRRKMPWGDEKIQTRSRFVRMLEK